MIAVIATVAGALLAAWFYWPLYREEEIRRLTDATLTRYARRYGRWRGERIERGRGYGCCHPNCGLGEGIEVIGNIHENPELLEAKP